MKTNPHINRLLGSAFAAVVAAGCAHVEPTIFDAPAALPEPVAAPPPREQVATPIPASYTLSSDTEIMRISLKVDSAGKESAGFAAAIRETAIGALRDRKLKIVTDGTEDIRLGIKADTSIYDNSADTYFTLDGSAAMRLDDAVDGRVLAEETLRGRNKASLGMAKAVLDVADVLKPAVEGWIAAKVTPEQIPLEARTLRITNTDRYAGGESAFIEDFVKAISAMDGVLRCETAERNGAAKTAKFRVLYRREKYPQGFIHAVVNQNPAFNLVLQ